MLQSKVLYSSEEKFETDVVIDQTSKIISNFLHLRSKKTTDQEYFLLSTARVEITRSKNPYFKKEFSNYEIIFYLSSADYDTIKNVIPEIRKNLKLKAKIIFQWFPPCMVEDIKVLVLEP